MGVLTFLFFAISGFMAIPLLSGSLWPSPFEWLTFLGLGLNIAALLTNEIIFGVFVYKKVITHQIVDSKELQKIYWILLVILGIVLTAYIGYKM